MGTVRKNEALVPGAVVCMWPGTSELDDLRRMHICGIRVPPPQDGCVAGYDIECNAGVGLPTPSSELTAVSIRCTCGYTWCGHRLPNATVQDHTTLYSTSGDLADAFMLRLLVHAPTWAVGYNNFSFDNMSLFYHTSLKRYYAPVRVAGKGLACTIQLPLTHNGDGYIFIDKTQRSSFASLSLAVVARTLRCGTKLSSTRATPDSGTEECDREIEYNVMDSHLAAKVWVECGASKSVPALCSVFRCPPIDACRYNTGMMTATLVAYEAMKKGMTMDWSPCEPMPYQGGHVGFKRAGSFRNVHEFDVASMYPSIVIAANISPETVVLGPTALPSREGSIFWNGDEVMMVVNSRLVTFSGRKRGLIPQIMHDLVVRRRGFPKSDPYNNALKVAANSLYGAMGYQQSNLYSPHCAAAVTSVGRWSIAAVEAVCLGLGWVTVYGDTDSVFITQGTPGACDVAVACKIANEVLRHTFLGTDFTLEHKTTGGPDRHMVCLTAKRYVRVLHNGRRVFKGVASVRKDRPAILSAIDNKLYPIIEAHANSPERARADMVRLFYSATSVISPGVASLAHVGVEVKVMGVVHIQYRAPSGKYVTVPVSTLPADRRQWGMVWFDSANMLSRAVEYMNRMCYMMGYNNGLRGIISRHTPGT